MQGGRRVWPSPPLSEIRCGGRSLEEPPEPSRHLENEFSHPVKIADDLVELKQTDRYEADRAGANLHLNKSHAASPLL
jgi:hypothetical protein